MKPGVFREEYIAIIVRELLRGLEYLHSEGKLHRDIKGALASMLAGPLAPLFLGVCASVWLTLFGLRL